MVSCIMWFVLFKARQLPGECRHIADAVLQMLFCNYLQVDYLMAEKSSSQCKTTNLKPPEKRRLQEPRQSDMVKVEFVITTYPELKPFLEMAVLLLEGVYELNACNTAQTYIKSGLLNGCKRWKKIYIKAIISLFLVLPSASVLRQPHQILII